MAALQTRLRLLRAATGETQTALGQALGVGQRTVWGWESGRVKPDWEMLGALADHYQCSVDYLIGRTDDPAPQRRALASPGLARWLRERLVERRLSLRALADAAAVPLAVLLEIQEGTAAEVAPAHLRALARHFGAGEDEVLAMAPRAHGRDGNADALGGVAAAAGDLTEEERRRVEALLREMRGQGGGGAGPDRA